MRVFVCDAAMLDTEGIEPPPKVSDRYFIVCRRSK